VEARDLAVGRGFDHPEFDRLVAVHGMAATVTNAALWT